MPKTLLITGANRGIGFEMTRQAEERGARVEVGGRRFCPVPRAGPVLILGFAVKSVFLIGFNMFLHPFF